MSLPSADTLKSASFIDSVDHAVTILKDTEHDVNAAQLELVSAMLRTSNGARGLFVSLLSDDRIPLADRELSSEFVDVLTLPDASEEERETVRVLITKNVVMSTAMIVYYRRRGDEEQRAGSQLTSERATRVAKACMKKDEGLSVTVREMLKGAEEGEGEFVEFLNKWGYDDEQKREAVRLLKEILDVEV